MTNEEKYNGYTNFETWNVSLWLNNDEVLHDTAITIVNRDYEYKHKRAEAIEEFTSDVMGIVIKDNISLWRVDWEEIAEEFLQKSEEIVKCHQ